MSGPYPDRRNFLNTIGLSIAATPLAACEPDQLPRSAGASNGSEQQRIEEFGAVGDGIHDDSSAFERALAVLPAGSVLLLKGGRQYLLTRSLIFTRPLMLCGGTKEHTQLIFSDGSYARLGGQSGALIFPHERTGKSNVSARRSVLSGFSVVWKGRSTARIHGCLISAPVYFREIDVNSFTGNGFHIEAESEHISGNANGSSFTNCSSKGNQGNGFYFSGDDANACLLLGARSFDNHYDGFHDASLLGNTYVGSEADGNRGAGYWSIKTTPNRSVFLGCYAEPNQRYDLNDRNLALGSLGHVTGQGGAMTRALPSGDSVSRNGHVFADDENAATGQGAAFRIARSGFDLRHDDGQRVRLTKLLSENYVDLLNGNRPLIRFPAKSVTGNITADRPWFPTGFAIGQSGFSGVLGAGAQPPSGGQFAAGALWLNDSPKPGAHVGWVCVSPGQWYPFGKIDDRK